MTTLKPFTRGDTFRRPLALTNGWEFEDFASLVCTIRRDVPESEVVTDTPENGVLAKVAVTGTGTAIEVLIAASVTTAWPGQTRLHGDIQGVTLDGDLKTLDKFNFLCEGDITRATV